MVGIVDNRTPNLDLPLADLENVQIVDVPRINAALEKLDILIPKKADLAAGGTVPAEQLPNDGYVRFYPSKAEFPAIGAEGRIYIDEGTEAREEYVWRAGQYRPINKVPRSTDDLAEGATKLYFTNERARAAIPYAGTMQAGVFKVGPGLVMSSDGTLSAITGGGGQTVPAFTEQIIVPTTQGQTEFVIGGGYFPGGIELLLNGVTLYGNGDDYTASDGTKITLGFGVGTSDALLLRRWTTTGNLPFSALTDRPTTMGGYGINDGVSKAGSALTGALDQADWLAIASAPAMMLVQANSNNVAVSGSASIADFGAASAGAYRRVKCLAAPTFVHSTKVQMPGAANFPAVAGDVFEFLSLGGGNWQCVSISLARGILDIVRLNDAQTLRNKTFGGGLRESVTRADITGTYALEPANASLLRLNVVANATVSIRAPIVDGEEMTIVFVRGAAGVTLSFGSNIKFDEDKTPTLPTAVGRALTVGLLSMNGVWLAYVGGVSHGGA